MSKQPVGVIIGREVQLTSPGMLGRRFDFKSGHSFLTHEWFYPGEPCQKDFSTGKPHDQWSFYTNTGTDLPLFFRAEDVREIVIPQDPIMIRVFEGAPFNVRVKDC
ncbi:MAG: hypothetical protein BGO78_02340 [Chloroflexi bacterium 44-23]|nr:MAG: hypothetical protein BGO78_02340 [Chloroflexi bacterium 44-23]